MKSKIFIWTLFFIPILYLLYKLGFQIPLLETYSKSFQTATHNYFGSFPTDPVKFISDITGITALQFLTLTLFVTPLKRYKIINLQRSRRLLGLMSFFYALSHMFLYLLLDHDLNIIALLEEAFDKQFIFFGMASLLILLFMALTSTKKLFAKFIKWHQLIYLATIFISFHYLLSQMIIGMSALLYVTTLLLLLILRKDKIKKLLSTLLQRLAHRHSKT